MFWVSEKSCMHWGQRWKPSIREQSHSPAHCVCPRSVNQVSLLICSPSHYSWSQDATAFENVYTLGPVTTLWEQPLSGGIEVILGHQRILSLQGLSKPAEARPKPAIGSSPLATAPSRLLVIGSQQVTVDRGKPRPAVFLNLIYWWDLPESRAEIGNPGPYLRSVDTDSPGKRVLKLCFHKDPKCFLGKNKFGKLGKCYFFIFPIALAFVGGGWRVEGLWAKVIEDRDSMCCISGTCWRKPFFGFPHFIIRSCIKWQCHRAWGVWCVCVHASLTGSPLCLLWGLSGV